MRDLLFENQQSLDERHLLRFAELLDLDIERFKFELEQQIHHHRVREDFVSGVKSGVTGTPSFFINGIHHEGPWQPLLEELLERAAVAD
jgi:protein-disulfide isomerase